MLDSKYTETNGTTSSEPTHIHPKAEKLDLDLRHQQQPELLYQRHILLSTKPQPSTVSVQGSEDMDWSYAVYQTVQTIPVGRITTYGHIAVLLGER